MEGAPEIAAIKTRIEAHEARITKHGEEIDELKIGAAKTDVILGRIDQTVAKIDGKLDILDSKPAQRWETIVTLVISVVVTAVVTYALSQAGLG